MKRQFLSVLVLSSALPAGSALAWKPVMHEFLAEQTYRDLMNRSGSFVEHRTDHISGVPETSCLSPLAADPLAYQALQDHPGQYGAGVLGPDAYPDLLTGQSVIHPDDDLGVQGRGADAWLSWLRRVHGARAARLGLGGHGERPDPSRPLHPRPRTCHAPSTVSDLTTKTVRRQGRRGRRGPACALVVAYSPDVDAVGRRWELDGGLELVGRRAEGRGRIDDPALSRQHFRVHAQDPNHLVIEDLGGANGTFVNGALVTKNRPLVGQDVISAGDSLFVVDAAPPRDELPSRDEVDVDIPEIIGTSLGAQRIRACLGTVAKEPGNVLVLGATGTGKELAAQAVHALSDRAGPIVATNCAAIPKDLAESELFGHVKGAFTGADANRDGYFARAHGGTLFLDEIGELPEPVQAKLLRVLETGEIIPVGSSAPKKVDVRVVGATLRDLAGTAFRADLFARLGDWVLRLPALADRRADILGLFDHFSGGEWPRTYDADVAEALLLCSWPMNVRELSKVAARARALAGRRPITLDDLPRELEALVPHRLELDDVDAADGPAVDEAVQEIPGLPPRGELEALLEQTGGNVKEAALRRGWHRTQLYRWIKRYGIDPARYRR